MTGGAVELMGPRPARFHGKNLGVVVGGAQNIEALVADIGGGSLKAVE